MSPLWVPPPFPSEVQRGDATGEPPGFNPQGALTITASGTAHTKGSWGAIIDSTSFDSYGVYIMLGDVRANNSSNGMMVDIAIADTGGGNEQVLIPNILATQVGQFATPNIDATLWYFPVFVPAGVRLAARCQATVVSDICTVRASLMHVPSYPPEVASVVTDIGSNTGTTRGTSVTIGNNAWGTWTQLTASTSQDYRFWAMGYGNNGDTSNSSLSYYIELGVGPNSSNVSVLGRWIVVSATTELCHIAHPNLVFHNPIPSGSGIWARAACPVTPNPTSFDIVAYGMD